MKVSQKIIEIFEDYLESKGVTIDNPERDERDEEVAIIYGTEYGDLQDIIEDILENETLQIVTECGCFLGKAHIEYGQILVESEALQNYLKTYSME